MDITAAGLWWLSAIVFAAIKIGSTVYGIVLKRSGLLFAGPIGWSVYLASKISAVLLAFAAWQYYTVTGEAAIAAVFCILTIAAAILSVAKVCREVVVYKRKLL